MAKKLSRSGKKKKPLYGPQGTLKETRKKEAVEKVENQQKKQSKKFDYGSLILIFIALAIILWKGRLPIDTMDYKVWISIAYAITILSGFFVLLSNRIRQVTSKISYLSAYLIIGIGSIGIYYTWFII